MQVMVNVVNRSKETQRVFHRERNTYPGILEARDVFIRTISPDGSTAWAITSPSEPYHKDW